MSFRHLAKVLKDIRRSTIVAGKVPMTDAQLLESFVVQGDEAGFEALVRRYGPLVFGVCKRVLRHAQDAEDAFQATFLVLVRKAAGLRRRDAVGNWLYGVAVRTAMKAKVRAARRRHKEAEVQPMAAETSSADLAAQLELHARLDLELNRLADKYRAPIVLCDLMGRTKPQAAEELNCPEGTVSSRLARGRDMLRRRLDPKGTALAAGTGVVLLDQAAAQAVSISMANATAKTALLFASGDIAVTGALSPNVAALLQGVMKSMLLSKLKPTLALLLAIAVVSTAAGVIAWGSAAGVALIPEGTGVLGKVEMRAVFDDESEQKESPKKEQLRYKGKDLSAWKETLLTDLDPELQIEALKAIGTFGVNGFGSEATIAVLELVKRHDVRGRFEPEDIKVIDTAGNTLTRIGAKAFAVLEKELQSTTVNDRRWAAWTLQFMVARFAAGSDALPSAVGGIPAGMAGPGAGFPGGMGGGFGGMGALGAGGMGALGAGGFGALGAGGDFPGGGGFPAGGFGALGAGGFGALGAGGGFPGGGRFAGFPAGGLGAVGGLGAAGGTTNTQLPGFPGAPAGNPFAPDLPFVPGFPPPRAMPEKELRMEAFPVIVLGVKDPDRLVRNRAMSAMLLGEDLWNAKVPPSMTAVEKQAMASALASALADEEFETRYLAARLLGWLDADAKSAVPALLKVLKENKIDTKFAAIVTIGRIGPAAKEAIPSLIKGLEENWGQPDAAADMFAAGGMEGATIRQMKILREISHSLGRMGADAKGAVPVLIKAIKPDANALDVRTQAVIALGRIGPGAKDAVPDLMNLLEPENGSPTLEAIIALGNIGPAAKEAIPKLLELSTRNVPNDSSELREAALKALKQIRE